MSLALTKALIEPSSVSAVCRKIIFWALECVYIPGKGNLGTKFELRRAPLPNCTKSMGVFFKYDVFSLAIQRLIGERNRECREGKEPGGRMNHMSKVMGCWKDTADPGSCVSFDLASM